MLKYFLFFLICLAAFKVQAVNVSISSPDGKLRGEWITEIADTPQKRETGLMNRPFLADNAGMLFDMSDVENPYNIAFWMKNTFIALDILFISADGTVFYIKENAQPLDETLIIPPFPPTSVMEIKGGQTKNKNIKIGDVIHKSNNT